MFRAENPIKFKIRYLLFVCIIILLVPIIGLRLLSVFPPVILADARVNVKAVPLGNRAFKPPLFEALLSITAGEMPSKTINDVFTQNSRKLIRENNDIILIADDFITPVTLKYQGLSYVGYGQTRTRKTPFVIEAKVIPESIQRERK
jgi:hypothetical protein